MSDPLTTQRGWVYFIGAGPGDPGLMTMRGAEIIKQATIVFFDRLVGDEVFDLVSPDAELVDVGKGPTAGGKSQRRTNELLIAAAKENHIVARLKGGDPFVFGRGGEEALDCADADVPFEIVPGVTSAIAAPAYAGIPVTHRGVSTNVCIVTGHGAEDAEPDVDWQSLGKGAGTLAVLMGVGRINRIVARLIEAGRDPKTPVALVRNGTRPDQETLVSTLDEVADEIARRKFRSPAVFIVGECARLRDRLAWIERRPLFGRRVIVTRPAGEAVELNAKLRAAGAQVAHCPTIRVEPTLDDPAIAGAIDALPGFNWLVLTSVNGVRCFFDALGRAGKDGRALAGLRVAAIGSKTGAALRECGIRPDLAPETFTQEGVLEAMGDVAGQRILLARAALARNVLPDTLKERGADVEIVTLYETVADEAGIERLTERLRQRQADWITFTSASTAQFLLAGVADADRAALFAGVATASIGPSTSAALRDGGLPVDAEATVSTSIGVYQAIVEHEGGE